MPFAEIATGITALNNALSIAKTLREAEKVYDAATYKLKIAELIEEMVSGKLALSEAKESISDLKAENDRLAAAFQDRTALLAGEGGYKYRPGEDGKPFGYPICPGCELKGTIVNLVQNGTSHTRGKCPSCSSEYHPVVQHDDDAVRRRSEAAARQSSNMRDLGRRLNGGIY